MPGRKRSISPPLPIHRFLLGLKRVVRRIDECRERDLRKVMLGLLLRDLKTADESIGSLAAEVEALRALHRELAREAARIEAQDGGPIAPDDDTNVHRLPPNLKPQAEGLWRLGLSVRSANRLAGSGITTWEQLAEIADSKLEALPGLGPESLEEIRRLQQRGKPAGGD
ncbi:MAG TPA: DNA-directed RNA polymerase subunit alpha C-terminal domain-containing protein [Thermoanaerobaculia bacterium]|nr:DNA-directed RNA polymerase subunit alpha C-terminal domain-containing protein [Thermoanaerobaculia bacterium]